MTVAFLSKNAEKYFKVVHLAPQDEEIIRQMVFNYAEPQTCCKKIYWVIYHAIEGIKSLFGFSDWQVAQKIISDRWMAILIEERLVTPGEQNEMRSSLYSNKAVSLLKSLVLTQEGGLPSSLPIEESIKKFDVVNDARKKVKGYTVDEVD